MDFIIAQILGIIGAGIAIVASQMKDKKKYLMVYTVSYVFFILNMLLLKAYAGAVNSFILMVLTIISTKFEKKKFPVWLIITFAVVILIGNKITYHNIFSLMPAVASYVYLIILLSKNMKTVRLLTIVLRVLWTIYDFIVKAYTTFVIDIFSVIASLFAFYRFDIRKKNN